MNKFGKQCDPWVILSFSIHVSVYSDGLETRDAARTFTNKHFAGWVRWKLQEVLQQLLTPKELVLSQILVVPASPWTTFD